MDLFSGFVDLVLHLDQHLRDLAQTYGAWVYAVLFLIVFLETGLVVTPFLPGDSLLFVAGTIAAAGELSVHSLVFLLIAAAIAGDSLNYSIGRYLGPKVFRFDDSRFFKRAYVDRTHLFFERHGGKAIVIARFVPIIRTYAPFVAGLCAVEALLLPLFIRGGGGVLGGARLVWRLFFLAIVEERAQVFDVCLIDIRLS